MRLIRVLCESPDGLEDIEGVVVDGTPINEWADGWDFDCPFQVLDDAGILWKVSGWNVQTTVVEI